MITERETRGFFGRRTKDSEERQEEEGKRCITRRGMSLLPIAMSILLIEAPGHLGSTAVNS